MKNYITPEGIDTLRKEYGELLNVERPKVVAVVAWAASNGDRSENADYIYGKRRLRQIDSRLHFLQKKIESAEIVDPKTITSDAVVFGALVKFTDEDGNLKEVQIVGKDEIDIQRNRISWQSPIAKALLGKKVGQEVELRKPSSAEYIIIEEILYC